MKKKDCKDCVCLVEGPNGSWWCDEVEKNIKDVVHCPEGVTNVECDECHKAARYNIQSGMILWTITGAGSYSKKPLIMSGGDTDVNEHLCEECFRRSSYPLMFPELKKERR